VPPKEKKREKDGLGESAREEKRNRYSAQSRGERKSYEGKVLTKTILWETDSLHGRRNFMPTIRFKRKGMGLSIGECINCEDITALEVLLSIEVEKEGRSTKWRKTYFMGERCAP